MLQAGTTFPGSTRNEAEGCGAARGSPHTTATPFNEKKRSKTSGGPKSMRVQEQGAGRWHLVVVLQYYRVRQLTSGAMYIREPVVARGRVKSKQVGITKR